MVIPIIVVYVVKEVRHSGGLGQLMGVGRKSTLELLCTEKQYEYDARFNK